MKNKALNDFMRGFLRKKVEDRFDLVKMYNKQGFVDDCVDRYGAKGSEIDEFFEFVCTWQIFEGQPLPNTGYLDLVRFAQDKRLFTKVEVLQRKGQKPR